jgi:hypothetical protein
MKYVILFILSSFFTFISRLILLAFNVSANRIGTLSVVMGVIFAFLGYNVFFENGSMLKSDSTNDIVVSNFKIETAYKVLKESDPKSPLGKFVIVYSMDVTNNSGKPIINFDGNGPDGTSFSGGGEFSAHFVLDNFNEMGDYKKLVSQNIYMFDDGVQVEEFTDERPFPDKKTYKLYGYVDLMGTSLGRSDTRFIDYFNSGVKFETKLFLNLLGSTPDDRTKYYFKKIETGIDISNFGDYVKKYQDDSSTTTMIIKKSGPYGLLKLTNIPWENNIKFPNRDQTEPIIVICQLFNLTPAKTVYEKNFGD